MTAREVVRELTMVANVAHEDLQGFLAARVGRRIRPWRRVEMERQPGAPVRWRVTLTATVDWCSCDNCRMWRTEGVANLDTSGARICEGVPCVGCGAFVQRPTSKARVAECWDCIERDGDDW